MCNRYEAPTRSAVERVWAARQVVEKEWDVDADRKLSHFLV